MICSTCPLPEAIKGVILSGFIIGAVGMFMIAWALGWLRQFDDEKPSDQPAASGSAHNRSRRTCDGWLGDRH